MNHVKNRLTEEFFEEVVVEHPARVVRRVDDSRTMLALLGATTTQCLPLQQQIDSRLCLACDHFVGCRQQPDGSVVIQCWTHMKQRRLARGTANIPIAIPPKKGDLL